MRPLFSTSKAAYQRVPGGIAIFAILAIFGFDFYRCFFIRLVRIAPCVPF
jgi:hypothetical protein